MNKAVPWNVKGIGFEARQAAHLAARKAGVPIGQWLDNVIAERASDLGVVVDDIDPSARLEALAARLAELAESTADGEDRDGSRKPSRRVSASDKPTSGPAASRARTDRVTVRHESQDRAANMDREALVDPRGADDERSLTRRSRSVNELPAADRSAGESRLVPDRRSARGRAMAAALAEAFDQVPDAMDPAPISRMRGDAPRLPSSRVPPGSGGAGQYRWREDVELPATRMREPSAEPLYTSYGPDQPSRSAHRDAAQSEPLAYSDDRLGSRNHAEIERIDSKLAAILARLNQSPSHAKTRDASVYAAPAERVPVAQPDRGAAVAAQSARMRDAVADIARRQADLDLPIAPRSTLLSETSYASIGQVQKDRGARLALKGAPTGGELPTVSGAQEAASLDDAFQALSIRLEARLDQAAKAKAAAEEEGRSEFEKLQNQMQDLGARLETVLPTGRPDPEQIRTLELLDRLRVDIGTLSQGVADLSKQASTARLEDAVRNLSGKIELSKLDGIGHAVLAPVEKLGAEMREAIQALDSRARVESLDGQVKMITRAVDLLHDSAVQPETIHVLQQTVDQIRAALTDSAKVPPFAQQMERELSRLGNRIERLADLPVGVGTAELDKAVAEIRASFERSAPTALLERLDSRLEDLSSRIDRQHRTAPTVESFAELSRQIEDTHASLAARLSARGEAKVDLQPLEALLSGIAGKIDGLQGTSPEMRTLDTLIRGLMLQIEESRGPLAESKVLDGFGSQLDRLDRKMDDLSVRFDGVDRFASEPSLFEDLSRQIEDTHDSLAARLSGRGANQNVDLEPLEQLLGSLAQKVDNLHGTTAEMRTLDTLIRGLMLQIEEARAPAADTRVLDALESQVGRLAERLDRSDASLDAISSLERSIGDLFQQLEDTRNVAIDAAENAARTAAQDTLRAAMNSPSLNGKELQTQTGLVAEHVSRELSDFRRAQDASEKRMHGTLRALSSTLERLVDRMVDDLHPATGKSFVNTERKSDGDQPLGLDGLKDAPKEDAAELAPAAALRAEAAKADDASEFDRPVSDPVAPEAASTRRIAPAVEIGRMPTVEITPQVSPLIAAARRAAQAAQVSAAASSRPKMEPVRVSGTPVAEASTMGFFAQKRRPLLLGLAAVVLLLGALQVVRLSSEFRSSSEPSETTAPTISAKPENRSDASPSQPIASPAATAADAASSSTSSSDSTASIPVDNGASAQQKTDVNAAAAPVLLPDPALGSMSAGLRDLAMRGDASAQYEVAVRLADGRGVTRDLKDSAVWFERAAKQGLAPAQYRLGSMYEKGLGVAVDAPTAITWYERAANQGNMRAMHNLAVLLAEGAKPDYVKSAAWFTKAANAGVRDSQYNLAILYARGLGVPQNLAQSYSWFAVAAAQGDTDAGRKRDEIAAKLDAKTVADVKAAADTFKPNVLDKAANEVSAPPGGWDVASPAKVLPGNAARDPKTKANAT